MPFIASALFHRSDKRQGLHHFKSSNAFHGNYIYSNDNNPWLLPVLGVASLTRVLWGQAERPRPRPQPRRVLHNPRSACQQLLPRGRGIHQVQNESCSIPLTRTLWNLPIHTLWSALGSPALAVTPPTALTTLTPWRNDRRPCEMINSSGWATPSRAH